MKFYRVNEKILHEYLVMAHYFHALECGGVDNWEWYGASVSNYIKDCSVIDETNYESIEEIVEAEMASLQICKCEDAITFDEATEILTSFGKDDEF